MPKPSLLPPGPTKLGWHSIEAALRCPKEYQYSHVRKVTVPLAQIPGPLGVGLLIHAARAEWFSSGFGTSAAVAKAVETAMRVEAEKQKLPIGEDALKQARNIFAQYVEHWSVHAPPMPKGVEYEIGPATLIPGDSSFGERTARLDDVSIYPEAGGQLWIGECKTTSQDISATVDEYTLHGQPMLQYALWTRAAQGLKAHGPVAGVMLDVIKKPDGRDGKCKFSRVGIRVEPFSLSWFVRDLRAYLSMAAAITWDSEVPHNITQCTRSIGRARIPCTYRELCRYGRDATSQYLLEGGKSLLSHSPEPGRSKMPWE